MSSVSNLIQGLLILIPYCENGIDEGVTAEHDIIYASEPLDGIKISEIDVKRLDELGWHMTSDTDWWAMFV